MRKKILTFSNIDFLAAGATVIKYTPKTGKRFIVESVITVNRATTGSIAAATLAIAAGTNAIVAAVLPLATAVGDSKALTVVSSPGKTVTKANPLKFTTVQGTTATVYKGDVVVEGYEY